MAYLADFEILIGWDEDYSYSGTYDNVTADVISVRTLIGFAKPWDRFPRTGTATLTLDNSDRNAHGIRGLYSPDNAASPLYGYNEPYKRVVIRATWDSVTYPIFMGYIEAVEPLENRRVKIQCVDGVDVLRQVGISIPTQQDIRSDTLIRLLTEMPVPPEAVERSCQLDDPIFGILDSTTVLPDLDSGYDMDEGIFVADYAGDTWRPGQTKIAAAIEEITTAEWGRFWVAPDGKYVFWNRSHEPEDLTNHLSINGELIDLDLTHSAKGVINKCRVQFTPRRVGPSNTVLARSDKAGGKINPGQTKTIRLELVNELGGTNIGVLSVKKPEAGIDYHVSSKRNGQGYDMTGVVDVDMEVSGSSIELTFTHTGTRHGSKSHYTQPAQISKIQVRGTPLYQYDTVEVVATDPAGQAHPKEKLIHIPLINDADFAQLLAEQQIQLLKDVQTFINSITLANADATIYEQMLTRGIMDLIDITEPDSGLDAKEVRIISIGHTIEGGWHTVRWGLEPRAYSGRVLLLDTVGYSELDENAYLGAF